MYNSVSYSFIIKRFGFLSCSCRHEMMINVLLIENLILKTYLTDVSIGAFIVISCGTGVGVGDVDS